MSISRKSRFRLDVQPLWVLLAVGLLSVQTGAEDVNTNTFVVLSEVTSEGFAPMQTQTLFRGTEVYDRVDRGDGIVKKFDLDQRTVRILDQKRKLQTSITFDRIGEFQAGARARTASHSLNKRDRLSVFMAEPKFTTKVDLGAKRIRLESPLVTYEAEVEPGAADVVDRYMEFADWAKQLATLLDRGCLAGPRMKLNRELKNKNFLAMRVSLDIAPDVHITCRHRYQYELSEDQEDFIQDVEKQLNTFPQTSLSKFLQSRKPHQSVAKN